MKLTALYSSPLERCVQTVEPLAAAQRLSVLPTPELIEMDAGSWTGRTLPQLRRTKLWKTVQESPSTFRFPDGEAFVDAQRRAVAEVERIARRHRRGRVAVATHGDIVRINHDPAYIVRADAPVSGKVGILSGGGSGREPMHGGFVGMGMLDAACPGEVFTSPTPDQMYEATKAIDGGAGVLHIVKNYTGDVLNFEMAADLARADGIEVEDITTPADWGERGMERGAPFAASHSFFQTGPFRPGNRWGENVVFTGSGTQPGVGVPMVLISGRLAAERITGPDPMYRSRVWR